MLDRFGAIRAIGAKVILGAAITASVAVMAACGSGTSTGGTSTNAALTSCAVTASDIAPTSTGAGTATKVAGVSGKISVDGSSALGPLFVKAGAEFDAANGTTTTDVANGSGTGLKDVEAGAVNIGLSDVFAQTKETTPGQYSNLVDHQVAVVAFTLIVNNDLKGKVSNLTVQDIQKIYLGQVTNWNQLGGPNELITVVNRPTTSGTRATFKQYILNNQNENNHGSITQDNTGAVVAAVKATQGSIGYVSIGFASTAPNDVSPICINGFKPIPTDINDGNYVFWGIEHAYTKGPATGAAKALLQYVESSQVQNNDLLALSYLKVSTLSSSATASHTPSGAPTPESFY